MAKTANINQSHGVRDGVFRLLVEAKAIAPITMPLASEIQAVDCVRPPSRNPRMTPQTTALATIANAAVKRRPVTPIDFNLKEQAQA